MMAPAFITRTAGPRGRIKALDHHHGADLTLSIDNFNEQELSPCPRMCRAGVLLRLWLPLVAWTIPACAGPTRARRHRHRPGQDYPRVRGADASGATESRPVAGLSPRARGRLSGVFSQVSADRTIPACAGPTQ